MEILSESTVEYDRFGKCARYRHTPSLRQYLLLDSRHAQAEVITRLDGDNGTYEALVQPTDAVRLATAGRCELTLAELYDNLLPFVSYDEPVA